MTRKNHQIVALDPKDDATYRDVAHVCAVGFGNATNQTVGSWLAGKSYDDDPAFYDQMYLDLVGPYRTEGFAFLIADHYGFIGGSAVGASVPIDPTKFQWFLDMPDFKKQAIGKLMAASDAAYAEIADDVKQYKLNNIGVDFVAVRPDKQGQGHGTALVQHVCKLADEQSVDAYLTTANTVNRDWYLKLGFVERTCFTIRPDQMPEISMWIMTYSGTKQTPANSTLNQVSDVNLEDDAVLRQAAHTCAMSFGNTARSSVIGWLLDTSYAEDADIWEKTYTAILERYRRSGLVFATFDHDGFCFATKGSDTVTTDPSKPSWTAQLPDFKKRALAQFGAATAAAWEKIVDDPKKYKHDNINIGVLAVRPDKQGLGYGASLVRHVCQLADRQSLDVYLGTADTVTRDWYLKFGFIERGVATVQPDQMPSLLMHLLTRSPKIIS